MEVTMINIFHPGIILIIIGFLAAAVPVRLRKILLTVGPGAVFFFTLFIPADANISFTVFNKYTFYLLEVTPENRTFLFIFTLIAFIGGIYAAHNRSRLEAFASMSYAGATIGATVSGDWGTLIFFWELMAVTSLFLIWANRSDISRKAGFRYLLAHMFGGNILLFGIIIKISQGNSLISSLSEGPRDLAFWLILLGMAINAAIVPLHFWVPDAYPCGTITGTVFLASFTTKLAVLCMIRVFAGTEFLIWFGVAMILYGALFALIENNFRRLLSYHIISQLGFMIADIGIGSELALNASTALAFSNIIYKALLFMCAGAIIYATGITKINQLGGLARKLPAVCVFFFIAALSIAGFPGLAGFTCKSLSVVAAEHAGLEAVVLLMKIGSIGTVLSICFKMGYFLFFGKPKTALEIRKPPANMYTAMGITSGLCILYGIAPLLIYRMLPYAMDYHPYSPAHILEYIQLLTVAAIPFLMFLKNMLPHTALSLDTDWFLRKPLAASVSAVSSLCCIIQDFFGSIGRKIYDSFTSLCSRSFNTGKDNKSRLSESDGPSHLKIGEGMIGILLTMIVVFFLLIFKTNLFR